MYIKEALNAGRQSGGIVWQFAFRPRSLRRSSLKEGDQIEIRIADVRTFEVQRDRSRQDALDKLRKLRRPLPPGFVFDRDDANAR